MPSERAGVARGLNVGAVFQVDKLQCPLSGRVYESAQRYCCNAL